MIQILDKPYDTCLLVGRFQHFHIGHESLITHAFKIADRVIIFVGSAQESGTLRNPFDVATRIDMIKSIYGESVIVKPLNDLSSENDITPDWGRYVLSNAKRYIYKVPEIMIYGNDCSRSRWFDLEDISETMEIIVPRSKIQISATELREFMIKDMREEWMKYVNPKLHKHYDRLRSELLATEPYRLLNNLLLQGKSYKEEYEKLL